MTPAYRGDAPFVFVSYSHDDTELVNSELAALTEAGVRVYYDEGIHPGNTWHDDLAKALDRCSLFVFFVTARSVVSRNCERELAFALDANKPVLPVYLEDTEVPPGIRLAIGNRQAIIRSRFDEASYRARLIAAIREYTRDAGALPSAPSVTTLDPSPKPRARRFRSALHVAAVVAVVAIGYAVFSHLRTAEEMRAARDHALAEAAALIQQDRYVDAFVLLRPFVIADKSGDAQLRTLWQQTIAPATPIVADADAKFSFKPYDDVNGTWIDAGTTPFATPLDLPRGVLRVRLEKDGYDTGEFTIANPGPTLKSTEKDNRRNGFVVADAPLPLAVSGSLPDDMVLVPHTNLPIMMTGLTLGFANTQQHDVAAFAIARHEVTNAQFKEFVVAGGYDNPAYWEGLDFVADGRTLTWPEARALFVDQTGRPGPSGWQLSSFPEGQSAMPVGGISWYEAVAYSRFRGVSLPTLHHWTRAAFPPFDAGFPTAPKIAYASRFRAAGPIAADAGVGFGPWGTLNTAGNVREWVWNRAGDNAVALGGAWGDYSGSYQQLYTTRPMDRSPDIGVRLMKSLAPVPDELLAPIAPPIDEQYMRREPVSNDAFEAMRFQFAAGHQIPRAVEVEIVQQTDAWIAEEVRLTFAPNDTFTLYVVRPVGHRGVLQPILYAPPGDAIAQRLPNRDALNQLRFADFVVASGRALVIPIWAGTYERWVPRPQDPQRAYDQLRVAPLRWHEDAARTLSYLATREDIDIDRLGLLAFSFGAVTIVPPILAIDGRFKAGVLIGAGIATEPVHPMDDAVNYAPRIRCPMLMINGSYDAIFPSDLSQRRLFELLGSPESDKKHVVYDVGHFYYPRNQMLREVSDWFDHYLGPVAR